MADNEKNPLDNLYEIVGDLWGTLRTDAAKAAAAPVKPAYKTSGTVDLPTKGEKPAQVIAADLAPFPVGQGRKRNRRDRSI